MSALSSVFSIGNSIFSSSSGYSDAEELKENIEIDIKNGKIQQAFNKVLLDTRQNWI